MEPTPVASSPQGTPSEPTESRTGSTADLSELLAKHASTVGNWASLVDEEGPVDESEGPAGVWMGASQRASEPLDKPLNNNFREYRPPYRCYVSYVQNRATESDIVNWFGGEQKVANILLHREGKILDCELELSDHDALLHAINLDGTDFGGRRIRVEYIGQGPPRKFSRPGAFPQQQQGGFRGPQGQNDFRGPQSQNDFRGVGRQPQQYGQYQQRDGGQRQRQQPQQQVPRNKPFVPHQEANDVRALQNRGEFGPPPVRPPPQTSPPSASAEHPTEQFKPPPTVPAAAPAPPAKPRVNPFGSAKPVDNSKYMEMDAKLLAERQSNVKAAKEKATAHLHAASGATSPSSTDPPALDNAPHMAGSIRIMKREDRVSEDSGVPRNESHRSLDANSERASDVSRKTSSSSSVAHDQQRQFPRASQPPQKYGGPAHTNTRDKKFVEKPRGIDSRRSTAERSDKSQSTRPPRPQQQPHPDGQRPRQQHGPPYGQKGGGRQAHEGRGGPRGAQKTDADNNAPVANKPADERRPSVTKPNEIDVKAPTDVAKEPDATPFTNGKPEQPIQPVADAKPSDHFVAPKKPLTFTNTARKASHSSSTGTAPPTPAADAVKQLPNGQAQAAASSVEQPAAPKAETASSKKKKEKKASAFCSTPNCLTHRFQAKAKDPAVTSKNKFVALLDCDFYD